MNTMTATTTPAAPALPAVPAVDIVHCAVFSAAGQGLEPLAAALSGRSAGASADPATLPGAELAGARHSLPVETRPVAGPQPAEILGRKGLRGLTRTDQLAVAACTVTLDALAGQGAGLPVDQTGWCSAAPSAAPAPGASSPGTPSSRRRPTSSTPPTSPAR
ncbi:hypothetical protein [Streptomyces sp. NPDC017529]|uniref:hypothetical protein n=1 Tax=Streptomyces sp. NPDC017529 TaxID=3365000 RepID=UPI0037B33989